MTPLDVLLLSYIKGCFVYCPFLLVQFILLFSYIGGVLSIVRFYWFGSDGSVPVFVSGAYAFQAFVCARSQSAHGSMPSPLSAEIGNT